MSESIQTSIYQLRSLIASKDEEGQLIKVSIDFEFLESEMTKIGYAKQEVNIKSVKKHNLSLYYKKWETDIKWKEYISVITKPRQNILDNNISVNESFLLFVKKKGDNNKIYAVTGGFGHTDIQKFINYQFGLDIISRLIKSNDKVLKSAKERNFVGGILGQVKYFRGDYNLIENESFGNYYHELRAKLDKDILKNIFKFKDDEIKNGGICDAKTSFTIRKPISVNRTLEIIDILDSLMHKSSFDLNFIKRLDKSDKALIESLDSEIVSQLFKVYIGKALDVNFEICHKYFDKFYDAKEFEVLYSVNRKKGSSVISNCSSFEDIIQVYMDGQVSIKDLNNFKSLIENTKIISYDEVGEQTNGSLLDHLCAEIFFNKKSYFLFNQEWYLVKPNFEKTLNTQCQYFLNENIIKGLLNKWDKKNESENDFNSNHIGIENTLVFDKVTPSNIEVCDILKWDDDKIFFIHVKEGFNNEMRNLGRQIHISAKRVLQDLKSNKEILSELYIKLSKMTPKTDYFLKAQKQLSDISKKDFLKLFDKRKIIFVLAVLDSGRNSSRNFSKISDFKSNIAKFCLQQLTQEMRLLDVELKVLEIEKS